MNLNMDELLETQNRLAAEIPAFKRFVEGMGVLPPDEIQKLVDEIIADPRVQEFLASWNIEKPMVPEAPGDTLSVPETDPRASGIFKKDMGLPAMNPLAEAALMERLQFDGDIPESRTGALPRDSRPAVPVLTEARNPVLIGSMLQQASEQVHWVIEGRREEALAALTQEGSVDASTDLAVLEEKLDGIDPEGYERGKLPVPVQVAGELATTSREAQEMAWAVRSTTQGRQSAKNPILSVIVNRLGHAGLKVTAVEWDSDRPREEVLSISRWSLPLSADRGSVQSNFSIIDVAAQAMASHLLEGLEKGLESVGVEIRVSDKIADRDVGWITRLVRT